MGSVKFQHHDALPGAHRRTRLHANLAHDAGQWREQGDFHLHRLRDHQHIAGRDTATGFYLDLPEVAGDVAVDALLAVFQRYIFGGLRGQLFTVEMRLATGDPAFALGIECAFLLIAKRVDGLGFPGQERLVLRQVQLTVLDVQVEAPEGEIPADAQQFIGADRVETDLVENRSNQGLPSNAATSR